jgi:hypothetical protein
MIPEFNDDGYLPSGIHLATLEEIAARFGQESELRVVQMESLRWLVELAKRAGVTRIVVNGSFVTDVQEPNDVDCVLLITPGFPADAAAAEKLRDGLPFIHMELLQQADLDVMLKTVFATDRLGTPKGMIEVLS